ncbi:MAG: DUF1214 domain-containing protein [Bauldia sp.]|nr:DUF1214 domain-containing protein [Bauldia sp.]
MRPFRDLAIAVAIAVTIGLASAAIAINQRANAGAASFGPWGARTGVAAGQADPYARAAAAATVDLPLGTAEGLTFAADTDSNGRALDAACVYTVRGRALPARLWTLTAYDGAGLLTANPSARNGFHSRNLVRAADGSFAIAVAATPQEGNWIPISGDGLLLVLRLYDTPLTTGLAPADLALPAIERGACR